MKAAASRVRWLRDQPWIWLPAALACFALILSRRLLLPTTVETAIWPTSGAIATCLFFLPARQRLYMIGAMLLCASVFGLLVGNPFRSLLGLSEGVSIGLLTVALMGPRPDFSQVRTLARYLLLIAIPVCAGTAIANLVLAPLFGQLTTPSRALQWFVGHSLGAAILAPALITIVCHRRYAGLGGRGWELAVVLAGVGAAAAALFSVGDSAYAFLLFPILMLVAFRHGPLGTASASLIISGAALIYIYGRAPQAILGPAALNEIQWIQTFVAIAFLTTLPAAGAVASYARLRNLLARRTATARHARQRADQASAAKGEFLANMSHEIRTPLNGVIGLTDALSRTELNPTQRELVAMVLASGKALTGLLSDALDLARAESGALRLTAEPFDLRQSIREAAFLFEALAHEKGLGFEVEFDLETKAAIGDSLRLKQIVSNLISNGVKFTSTGKVVVHAAFRQHGPGQGLLTVVVRDTGPGFGPEVKARLFNRFEQGDSSVTRRFGGSGLGLAIASRIARMMGGSLDCDAVPGEGAVFTLTAPLTIAAAPPVAAPAQLVAAPAADGESPLRVLLAEDNHINQKVVQAMLGELVELTIVGDGQAAIEAVTAGAFDLVLMDTHMPVLDGLSAIRRIRAAEAPGQRLPIISLTADAMPQQVAAARAAGADIHVPKPITAEALLQALQAALRGSERDAA